MLNGLNDHQIEAVTSSGNTLVIACPGSGKTRVLTRKIAYELERLRSKKKFIVALTYTNRAAEEIQRRLDELGIPQEQLWAGTIHSFCYQWIIKPYAAYEPTLVNGFSLIDDYKKQTILKNLLEKYSLPIYSDINTSFNRDGEYLNKDPYNNLVAKEFHQIILDNKEIDFDLLLYHSYTLLKSHKKIRNHLASLCTYIFVDEFQDTQDLQYAIIGQIMMERKGECKIFLVGDPDQAIYNSLGGIPKDIQEIQSEIGNQEIEQKYLPGNYRSTQRIVDFFKEFQSTDVKIQAFSPYSDENGLISLDNATNKNDLYKKFADIIMNNLESGVKPNEICIIAPQWYFLTPLAKKLKTILPDVPFEASGITPLPRNKENFWWKLSRLFLTEISLQTTLSRYRWIESVVLELNEYTNSSLGISYNDCRRYLKLLNSIHPRETDGIKYLEFAFKEFFDVLEIDLDTHLVLKNQWDTFFNSIRSRYESSEFEGIPSDVNYFKSVFKPSEGVVINTCYGVKGEEFETVIAFGLLWGYIPHWSSIINQSSYIADSASKKMLYVIGSRAKKNLHMFAETGRETKKGNSYKMNYHLEQVSFKYDQPVIEKIEIV
ncbi:UvrD-helicase domain-containing protein [Bacillus sp. TE8-1]|uniref:UvrD-helicase domain-containing protein n=1 Tax=Bacillus sp. TE8-1 TaxID=2217829 RepID=UPI0011F0280D|nr:ATP-dependent helicase [Bacillus sp. TE8-1]KAA0761722.1 ATP-dependent helicase [Bacillus sp. TE8-1]